MNAQNAYNILSSSNAQRTAQKSKANRNITTFSLSDVFHRSSAQSSAARVPPKSFSISSTPDKVVHKANPWAHATSLSNPSPPVSLAAIIDELEREECGANNAIPIVTVKVSKLVSEELSASAEIVGVPGLKSKQTVPTHPPPIPPPTALGRKIAPKKARITTSLRDFTSAFSAEASVNVASGDADGCEPHEVESIPIWTSLYDEEEDLSLPIPSWMMQHLPAQPPPIPPPPSKPSKAAGKEPDKGKMKKGKNAEIQVPPSRSDEEKCKPRGSREIEGYLMAQAIGEPNWEMKFEEIRPEVTLGLRSKVLPSGPPDVLPPPTVVKQQPAQPKKAKKSEKPKLATTVSSWSKPLQVDAPVRPKKAQKLPEWDDISSVDAVILPPSLRRVLPDGPPIASLPPSLEKKPKKKDGKHADSDLNSQEKQSDVSLALFVPHSTNESHSATSNRHRRTTLASIEEDDAPVDVAAKIPERLRTKLPTEPPAIPPPPVHKSKSLNSADNLGKSKSQPQDIRNTALQLSKSISEPLNRKHAATNCGSPTPSSLGIPESSSTVFDEDQDWPGGSPTLSASSLPERLRLRLPDGPPPVPEPPALRGKQSTSRRRKSVTASTSPPFSPSYTEGLYDAYLPDDFDLNDILDYSDYLYHTRYPSPPSPFSDDDTLIASPIPAELAPISRKLPDQPPSIPPPPMSPSISRNGLGKQKRRPSVSNPLASFIPAYAREEDGQDSSGQLSPSSSDGLGLGSYVGDQKERLRNLRRDYAARTKGLQELQEERQKARSMKGGKGFVNGASVHWQIRWETAKMHAFNAARNMVKGSRIIEPNGLLTYDLHGVMVEEARRIVIDILEEEYDCLDSKNARSFRLKLVTGRGAHSVNDARVKPAVQEALDDDGWDYTKHEGYFVVLGRPIDGQDDVVENEMETGKKAKKKKRKKNNGTDIAQIVEHQTMVHLSESEFPVCGAALA